MEKISALLCTGCDIGKAIKVDSLQEIATEAGASSWETHACLCSPEGVAKVQEAATGEADGLLIAACSPRVKTLEFRVDPFDATVERVSLREQVAWTHPHDHEDTQMLADDLVRMGVTKLTKLEKPKKLEAEVGETILVVGGGLTGLTAARAASQLGHLVVLVEAKGELGGHLLGINGVVPEVPPYDELHDNPVPALVDEVSKDGSITVHTGTKVKEIKGQPGQLGVTLENGESFTVGAIVQATGSTPYDASKLGHLGYGSSDKVVTAAELDRMLIEGKLKGDPKHLVFVQCAGSRDEEHLPYCSSECCATTLRQVATLHRDHPGIECSVIYKDMRAPGQLEHFFLAVQEKTPTRFARGTVSAVSNGGGKLKVKLAESLLGDGAQLEADMVVLATGMCPSSADGEAIRELRDARVRIEKKESESQVKAAQEVVDTLQHHDGTEILNLSYRQGPDLPVLRYAFPDSHYICFPYETRRTGIYAAGSLRAPMDAAQSVEDAWGAAMKASQCIRMAQRGEAVHPRAGDVGVADFFLQRCTQCKRCTEECPFGSLDEDEKGTPEYNQLRCRRCGICLGACPERIISFPDYSVDAIASMIKSIEVPDEEEEKPRIVVIACENDALPAIDKAAARGATWNAWMRIIPIRCLGAVNNVWIADSLSGGIDGILLLGCKKGDDYQCHYMRGSELAETRMTNVKETLDRLTLESERVRIVDVEHDDYAKIEQIFADFVETIDDVGPNPYKGF